MLIVNSPSNPTGWVITVDEQRALCELAERHDLVILSDEVYERLVFEPALAPSFARVATNKDRLIVVNSFSKTYNMTGWRLGWAQASEATIRTMYKAAEFITSNAAAMVQQAGIVALRDGEPYLRDLRDHYGARRAQVMAALREIPGVPGRAGRRVLCVLQHRRPHRQHGLYLAAGARDRTGAHAWRRVRRGWGGLRSAVLCGERANGHRSLATLVGLPRGIVSTPLNHR